MKTASELKEEGNHFYREKKYKNALESYQKAIEIDPCYKEAWFNRGMCYIQLEQTSRAIKCFEEALKIDPDYEKPRFHLNKLKLPAHILFGIVDLKFTADEQIKLLEFGGIDSNFSGYDRLYSSHDNTKKMINVFKKELSQYSILEATLPDAIRLSRNVPFSTTASSELKDYSTIFILLQSKIKREDSPEYLSKNILILDGSIAWQMVAGNKYVMHKLVDTEKYSKYRPRCEAYPARYENGLAEKIKASMPAEIYVLKAPNLSRGEGVIIVNANDLDRVLRGLLCDDDNQPKEYKDWLSQGGQQVFLVEEYCPSKEFKLGNQRYEPTMRVAFIIKVDKGCATFKPLGCYWKLPKEPLDSKGMLRDRTISQITDQGLGAEKVSQEDEEKVYKQLTSFLPALFLDILYTDAQKMVDDLKNNHDDLIKTYGYVLQLSCLERGRRLEGKWWSITDKKEIPISTKQLKKVEGSKFRYYNEKGFLYSLFGNYEKAIKQYGKSLQQDPNNACTFFLRSLVYQVEGQNQRKAADYKTYQELAKSPR